jgi:hypothetical protein
MGLDSLRYTVQSLIVALGKPMTLQRTIKGAYTPQTGTSGADTVTTYAVMGTPPAAAKLTQQPGSLIQAGDMLVSLSAAALEALPLGSDPNTETDVLIIDGNTWKIIAVSLVYIQSQIGLYELVLRK